MSAGTGDRRVWNPKSEGWSSTPATVAWTLGTKDCWWPRRWFTTLSRRRHGGPPYAAMATSRFAYAEGSICESSRCHLHPDQVHQRHPRGKAAGKRTAEKREREAYASVPRGRASSARGLSRARGHDGCRRRPTMRAAGVGSAKSTTSGCVMASGSLSRSRAWSVVPRIAEPLSARRGRPRDR